MYIIENYIKIVFNNYATFTGRATRSEYWYFFLANFIIGFLIGFFQGLSGSVQPAETNLTINLYTLGILIPSIAVAVRRIHDSGKSGWWILLPFYNLYLLVKKGTEGDNRFGSDPLQIENNETLQDS